MDYCIESLPTMIDARLSTSELTRLDLSSIYRVTRHKYGSYDDLGTCDIRVKLGAYIKGRWRYKKIFKASKNTSHFVLPVSLGGRWGLWWNKEYEAELDELMGLLSLVK